MDIIILGSTGSIGKATLNALNKSNKNFNVKLLTTNNNIKLLFNQSIKYKCKKVVIFDKEKFFKSSYKKRFLKKKIKVYFNLNNLNQILLNKRATYTISAISGLSGLVPTIKIIQHTKTIAIANKESIICAWDIIKKELNRYKTNFIPVDSEHFSIWSLINSKKNNNIDKIYLTASGGPFFKKKIDKKKIKPHQALQHPNWSMGRKISIDSATMMNKVFEFIEAKKIFNLNIDQLKIIIHPKSFIHAIVIFKGGLVKFLAHKTSMEIPILNSIYQNYDKKIMNNNINLSMLNGENFFKPDTKKFPVLNILKLLPKNKSYFETILITINDYLVNKFLSNKIDYFSIQKKILLFIKDPFLTKFYRYHPKRIDDITKMSNITKNYLDKKICDEK